MKCLSLWQPYASLLAHGKKQVETRGWELRHRGPLLIHAAKKWDADLAFQAADSLFFRPALEALGIVFTSDEAACRRGWGLTFGAVLGCVNVLGCFRTEDARDGLSADPSVKTGPGYRFLDIGIRERAFGDYSPGRFAILCNGFIPFKRPIPFPGKQGLFEVPDRVITEAA